MFNQNNNNKTNYKNFSNNKNNNVLKNEPVVSEIEKEEVKEPEIVETSIKGVTNIRLRVREEASIKSKELTILDKDAEVTIIDKNASEEFYKIVTAVGLEGYCMKKYIDITE